MKTARGIAFGIIAVAAAAALPASAQRAGKQLANGVGKADFAAMAPVVQAILDEDRPGAVRPWHSNDGKTGRVHLLSGGAKTGEVCGRLRLTAIVGGVESAGYRFRYCRDAAGRWRTAG